MKGRPKLKHAKVAGKTNLAAYAPFLEEIGRRHPGKEPVVFGGHAVNFWLAQYRDRFPDPERYRTLLGRDLDCLASTKLVADEFAKDNDRYHPPAIFVPDLLFLTLRRSILRQRYTPGMPWFILRLGKVNVPLPGSSKVIHVDFFAHTMGYHPDYVRRRAVEARIPQSEKGCRMMDPVQCLWLFVCNSRYLHQTKGDSGPRRRKDHLRTLLLGPIVREYLSDLAKQAREDPGNSACAQLESALDDLAGFLPREASRVVAQQFDIHWANLLPEGLERISRSITKSVRRIRKAASKAPYSEQKFLGMANQPTPGTLGQLPEACLGRVRGDLGKQ